MNRLLALVSALILVAVVQLDASGTHLLPVLVGMALTMGAVLVVAAAELSNGKWIGPVRHPLLATAPLLFVFPLLAKLAPYPWLTHETRWLRKDFFLARDVVALLAVAIVAVLFARAARAGKPTAKKWAVTYILTFVTVKTLVAMDWVMSFDYPWISTMFPVLYMVECFYAGLALIGLICFARRQADGVGYDAATLLFGFALFWGGLTFAQYLTIWYGNLPEEVVFFTKRLALPAGSWVFTATIFALFVIPFCTLLIHNARTSSTVVLLVSVIGFSGLFLQRFFHVLPYVNLNFGFLALETVAMLGAIVFTIRASLQRD